MFATTKALSSNAKVIFSKIVQNGFSQAKNGSLPNSMNFNNIFVSENSKLNGNSITKNIGFNITQAKHVSEIINQVPVDINLKKIQKTAEYAHCFNPKNHQQEDIPIRIFRTHYTVTFLPSVEFLENNFSAHKGVETVYNADKDSALSLYKFSCKHCGHKQTRSFPENGYKFGTVLTGCDQCHEVMLVSDHLGWVQPKKQKHYTDVIFSKKQVHEIIKKNLKKVGIDAQRQKQLD